MTVPRDKSAHMAHLRAYSTHMTHLRAHRTHMTHLRAHSKHMTHPRARSTHMTHLMADAVHTVDTLAAVTPHTAHPPPVTSRVADTDWLSLRPPAADELDVPVRREKQMMVMPDAICTAPRLNAHAVLARFDEPTDWPAQGGWRG